MISQHWFRRWLGAVRQQAITWANVDPDLCCHLASPGHNELTHWGVVVSWRYRTGSTLTQVAACRLMAPSHHLNQCWLIISLVLWHTQEIWFSYNYLQAILMLQNCLLEFWPKRDTPYLALVGELWRVFVTILDKIDSVIMARHCTTYTIVVLFAMSWGNNGHARNLTSKDSFLVFWNFAHGKLMSSPVSYALCYMLAWTPMSSVPKKAVKLNLSLSLYVSLVALGLLSCNISSACYISNACRLYTVQNVVYCIPFKWANWQLVRNGLLRLMRLEYSVRNRLIPWLLMPWLLSSSDHKQL